MSDIDELDYNPFFKALQGKFSSLYDTAQNECYLICIPRSDCLHGAVINQKFVETHILKPSPFFKGEYRTLRSDKQVVKIADEGTSVITEEGFPTKTKIKVVSEELGYNKEYKPYKMLVIERPLDNNIARKGGTDNSTGSEDLSIQYNLKDCRKYLETFKELETPLKTLDAEIQKFQKSYVLLKDYLHAAAERLENIAISTTETCVKCLKDRKLFVPKIKDVVTASVETCLIGSVHEKLYSVVSSKFEAEDGALLTKCHRLQGLKPEHIAVPKHFSCPLTAAVEQLGQLDNLMTPIEKLYCLKATIDNITEDVNIHIRDSQPVGVALEDIPRLTSDELIPILVTVLVEAKCSHVHSDIYYIENFCWSADNKDADTLSYCLVTFKATVQYLTTTDFSDIDLNPHGAMNGTSLKPGSAKRQTPSPLETVLQVSEESKSNQSRSSASSKPRYERQLEDITKMLEISTKGMKPVKEKSATQPVVASIFGGQSMSISPVPDSQSKLQKQGQKEDMGDFLSSLQNDFLSFGKQS